MAGRKTFKTEELKNLYTGGNGTLTAALLGLAADGYLEPLGNDEWKVLEKGELATVTKTWADVLNKKK